MRLVSDLIGAVPNGRRRMICAVLLAALASASSVALMGVSAWLISFAALAPPVLYLQPAAVGVRAFGIARGAFRYVERIVGHDVALRMQAALRVRVYDKLAATTLIGRRRGDLLTRVVSDVTAIQDVVVRVVIPFASAAVVVIGTTVMLAVFNLPSALALLVTAVLAGVVAPLWTQRMSLRADLESVPTRGRLADGIRELALTSTDLVAYDADEEELDRLLAVDDELRRQESRGAWVRGIANGVQILAAGIAVGAALIFGTAAISSGGARPALPRRPRAHAARHARGARHLRPGGADIHPRPLSARPDHRAARRAAGRHRRRHAGHRCRAGSHADRRDGRLADLGAGAERRRPERHAGKQGGARRPLRGGQDDDRGHRHGPDPADLR